jgi:hypothetical protein
MDKGIGNPVEDCDNHSEPRKIDAKPVTRDFPRHFPISPRRQGGSFQALARNHWRHVGAHALSLLQVFPCDAMANYRC